MAVTPPSTINSPPALPGLLTDGIDAQHRSLEPVPAREAHALLPPAEATVVLPRARPTAPAPSIEAWLIQQFQPTFPTEEALRQAQAAFVALSAAGKPGDERDADDEPLRKILQEQRDLGHLLRAFCNMLLQG